MKVFKFLIVVLAGISLNSCLVTTAAKVVTTTAKIGYSAVKGTVNGVSWAVKKAEGKINEDRLDGQWKIVGVYNGNYEQFSKDSNPQNVYINSCTSATEVLEFKTRKEKFRPVHCATQDEDWVKYKYKFGKNPKTKSKENYLRYNANNYLSIIDVSNNTMVLEGNLMPKYAFSGGNLYLLEKIK